MRSAEQAAGARGLDFRLSAAEIAEIDAARRDTEGMEAARPA
jgi:hypothetical protein